MEIANFKWWSSIVDNYMSLNEKLQCHRHELILNEDYHSHEGDHCYGCGLLLHSSSAVYHCIYFRCAEEDDCAHFFLHKRCAHLPNRIKHPSHYYHDLDLIESRFLIKKSCGICGIKSKGLCYCCQVCSNVDVICLTCVIPLEKCNIHPAYHCHELTLSTRLATLYCDACHKVDTDFSYTCHTCPFWIHLSCSNLPNLLECKIHHKHPLSLAYSLPETYRKFPQSCTICTRKMDQSHWLYYCPNCRFFAHIRCATSPPISRKSYKYHDEADQDKSNLVHLPVPDYELLFKQYIEKKIIYWLDEAPVTPPLHINHWSHEHHEMVLKNRSGSSTTDDEGLLICNGCTKSISPGDDSGEVFYECSECEYILHRYCALLPKEMKIYLEGKLVGIQPRVHDIWSCTRCEGFRNGTLMQTTYISRIGTKSIIDVKLDSECALLPKLIKHESHLHRLIQDHSYIDCECRACHKPIRRGDTLFRCILGFGYCRFSIHMKCALKPLTLTHRWDRHPLKLIFSPEEVVDHPHEFQCEFCSEEIDTHCWFYHCSVCDLSFHLGECVDLNPYSRVKFGATDIKIQDHQHSLTFVLNKKRQPCQRCHKDTYGKPVLECKPCKFIQHAQPELCS